MMTFTSFLKSGYFYIWGTMKYRTLPSFKQSSIYSFLFITIGTILLYSPVYAQNQDDSTSQIKPDKETILFAPHACVTFHYPVKWGGYIWKPFITSGLHLDFPTTLHRMLVRFSVEAGKIDIEKNEQTEKFERIIEDLKIACMALSVSYDIPIIKDKFTIRPRLGLSNTMIYEGTITVKKVFVILRESENEFGVLGGVEPIYQIKRILIALPMYGNIMFSSPEPFITGNISLTVGVVF